MRASRFIFGRGAVVLRAAIALCSVLIAGCAKQPASEDRDWLRVVRIQPPLDEDRGLLLNQEIEVSFNRAIDPLSLRDHSFQVVDQDGVRIPGTLRIGWSGRRIRFVPFPPLAQDLRDGSFQLDRPYGIRLPGFPKLQGLRSRSGQVLERSLSWSFRTLAWGPDSELGTPFVPKDIGEGFALLRAQASIPRADKARLRLEFNLPVFPGSLLPGAVAVTLGGDPLNTSNLRILPQEGLLSRQYGSIVQLEIEDPVDPQDYLIALFPEDNGLVDYRGRSHGDRFRHVQHVTEERFASIDVSLEDLSYDPVEFSDLHFAWTEDGLRPVYRELTGDASHGRFAPTRNLTLSPGRVFENATGARHWVPTDGVLQFSSIYIPPDVVVTLESGAEHVGLHLLSTSDIVIDGELRVSGPLAAWDDAEIENLGRVDHGIHELVRRSPMALVAGSGIVMRGQVQANEGERRGSPLTLVSGGDLRIAGSIPPNCALACGNKVEGSLTRVVPPLPRGLHFKQVPEGSEFQAEAWTGWVAVGAQQPATAAVELVGDHLAGFDVRIQTTEPDLIRSSEVPADAAVRGKVYPLSNGAEVPVPARGFVRFHLTGRLRSDAKVPLLRRILLSLH